MIGVIIFLIIYLPYKLINTCFGPCSPPEEWAKVTKRTFLKRDRRQQTTAEKRTGKKKKFYHVNTQVTYASQKDTVQTFGPQIPQHERLRSFKPNNEVPNPDLNPKQHRENPEGEAPEDTPEPVPANSEEIYKEVPRRPTSSYTRIYPDPRIWGTTFLEPKEGTWNVDEEKRNK